MLNFTVYRIKAYMTSKQFCVFIIDLFCIRLLLMYPSYTAEAVQAFFLVSSRLVTNDETRRDETRRDHYNCF